MTLTSNDSQKYEDRWVTLEVGETNCVWLPAEDDMFSDTIELPVAHAEGKFVPASSEVLDTLKENGQIVVRYVSPEGGEAAYPANPNGSVEGIAGITDPTGRVFGLMPHPERYICRRQHPRWTRGEGRGDGRWGGDGSAVFQNAIGALSS